MPTFEICTAFDLSAYGAATVTAPDLDTALVAIRAAHAEEPMPEGCTISPALWHDWTADPGGAHGYRVVDVAQGDEILAEDIALEAAPAVVLSKATARRIARALRAAALVFDGIQAAGTAELRSCAEFLPAEPAACFAREGAA